MSLSMDGHVTRAVPLVAEYGVEGRACSNLPSGFKSATGRSAGAALGTQPSGVSSSWGRSVIFVEIVVLKYSSEVISLVALKEAIVYYVHHPNKPYTDGNFCPVEI